MQKPTLLLYMLCTFNAVTLAASSQDNQVLADAHHALLQFREGHTEVARPVVKTLEKAVARSPNNARLWEELGHAYMALQGTLYTAGPPDVPTLTATAGRARDAYSRAIALGDKRPLVFVSHGMSQMVVSQLKGDGPGVMAGIEEMNDAASKYPQSIGVRLTRGFTIIHLPPDMRDTPAVTEDLKFILDTAPGGRAEDVLHVLLGDVYAESGNPDAARAEYTQVTGASAFAAEQAKSRLKSGTVSPDAIAQVRMGTGTRCAMCHAPGTDD